ncbi:MAG: GNAT family N-acetyltransferase [Oscillospiraceae bacterium]
MIRLLDVTEENWLEVAALSVREEQKNFVAPAIGILARGYVYRNCNSRVIVFADDNRIVGTALVRDLDEEPACYDLQEFMIDKRFQNRGYGTKALSLILELLDAERKYECIEVCVNKFDAPALHVYEKAGFADTGYIDDDVPDCLNFMYHFK